MIDKTKLKKNRVDDILYGYSHKEILQIDFRKNEGKTLLKKCGLTCKELKDKILDQQIKTQTICLNIKLHQGEIVDVDTIKKFKFVEIKNILKYIKQDYNGKKDILCYRLYSFAIFLNTILRKNKLILCQKIIRGFLIRNRNYYKGPGYLNRSKCVNIEDFYTCENICNIPDDYFFSYKENKFIYSYDIRSFMNLLKHNCNNPYSNIPITENSILMFNLRIKQMSRFGIQIETYKDVVELTDEQQFNLKVVDVFQKMNGLGHYTNTEWFTKLSCRRLKKWYKEAEDIFNFRVNLTEEEKKKIIPDGNSFNMRVMDVYNIHDTFKRKIQYIILNEIDRFISLGESHNDRYTGSLYMLTAFTMVSSEVANALPWLCQ